MRGAAADLDTLDRALTALAGLVFAAINFEAIAKLAHVAVGITVIAEGSAAEPDGLLENGFYVLQQPADFFLRNGSAEGFRMDAGGKEGFVGVNVAEAADAILVEQKGFYRTLTVEQGNEFFGLYVERFRAESAHPGGFHGRVGISGIEVAKQPQSAESSRIDETQL